MGHYTFLPLALNCSFSGCEIEVNGQLLGAVKRNKGLCVDYEIDIVDETEYQTEGKRFLEAKEEFEGQK